MTIKSAPSGTCFLENIRDLDILTSMSRVLVTIKIGDSTVYDEFLYPADGEIQLSASQTSIGLMPDSSSSLTLSSPSRSRKSLQV